MEGLAKAIVREAKALLTVYGNYTCDISSMAQQSYDTVQKDFQMAIAIKGDKQIGKEIATRVYTAKGIKEAMKSEDSFAKWFKSSDSMIGVQTADTVILMDLLRACERVPRDLYQAMKNIYRLSVAMQRFL